MKTKNLCLTLSLSGALLFAVGAVFLGGQPVRADEVGTGQAAPAWKLRDLDGNEVTSEQLKGKVVVLDFWATWCGPCVSEIPGYVELQKKFGPQGLVIVGASVDRIGPMAVKKFARAKNMNYTLVMASDEVVEAFGGVDAIPTTFLIDRTGRIVNKKVGAVPHDEYEKLVAQAMK